MLSFISASKASALGYAKALFGICLSLIIAFELSSAYLLRHYSDTYARVSQQYAEAVKARPSRPGEPIAVLMVGNSLLLEGVDVDRLQNLTSTKMRVYPIFLEATGYYDWLYGLRRLFRNGARPQVVVLGVGVDYFVANAVRQEYAPMLLLDARDTLDAASDLQLDRTATSNLLLAHWSAFWDTRSVIRTRVLTYMIPHVKDLLSLASPRPDTLAGPAFDQVTIPRLHRLRELCEAYGAKLILLVPPTLSSETAVREMALVAQRLGVDISVPVDPAALSAKFYQSDGMHLNSGGAVLFTASLARDLPKKLTVREAIASRE